MSRNVIEEIRTNNKTRNPILDALLWVAQARSIDPSRKILTGIHVEPDSKYPTFTTLVATDGRRLHVARVEKVMETGDYKIWKSSPMAFLAVSHDFGQQYPKWHQVVPTRSTNPMTKIELVPGKLETGIRMFKLACQCHALNHAFFNLNYLRQATDGMWSECMAYQEDATSPLLFQDVEAGRWERLAVVMPVRVQ